MAMKEKRAFAIFQGLSEIWNCEELQDFTVTVGETKFGCHKLLLAACSGYFRGLFRSGMRETQLNCVTIDDISSDTFQLILETIYTGREILTKDNVIDIWKAASRFLIYFMIPECELVVINSLSLDNYTQYFHYGRLLRSKIVAEKVWKFLLENCNSVFKTSSFLELPFADVLNLIKSQDLATGSEDEVLLAILDWVKFTTKCAHKSETNSFIKIDDVNNTVTIFDENTTRFEPKEINTDDQKLTPYERNLSSDKMERSNDSSADSHNREQHLFELVMNARPYLVSLECLQMLLSHSLVRGNKETEDIVKRAISYQLHDYQRNGQWPRGATHRNTSNLENFAIKHVGGETPFEVFSFCRGEWYYCNCDYVSNGEVILRLVTVANTLYCLYIDDDEYSDTDCHLSMFGLDPTYFSWLNINVLLILKSDSFFVVTVDKLMYIVQRKKIWQLNPVSTTLAQLPDLPDDLPICNLTCYDKNILAFYFVSKVDGVMETGVLSFDLLNNTWTRLNNIEGPANGMISFKDDHSTYLLQSNGAIWKLVKPQSGVVDFEFVVKLWSGDWELHGAVTFLDVLYIHGVKSETINYEPQLLKSVNGLFTKIMYLQSQERGSTKSMFVPFIASKDIIDDIR